MNKSDIRAGKAARSGTGPRTLIIHIGDHKTGSTTIQHALALGHIRIDGASPFYGVPLDHNHFPALGRAILDGSERAGAGHQVFAALAEAMARNMTQSGNRICMISAEEFEGFGPRNLHRLIDIYFADLFDRIRVVAYVRPHLQRIVSQHAERTKIGVFNGDLEAFFDFCVERKLLFYTPRFTSWHKVFGEAFILRPSVRSALRGGSLLEDFFTSALGDVQIATKDPGNQNESLSLEDLLRVKFLHAQLEGHSRQFHGSYGWALTRLIQELPGDRTSTRIRMHRSLAERVRDRYQDDAQKLDKAFFGATPYMQEALDEGVESACNQPQPSSAEAIFPPSELRSLKLTARLIEELLENNAKPWPEHFRKRRLEALHGGAIPNLPG